MSIFSSIPSNDLTNGILSKLGLGGTSTLEANVASIIGKNLNHAIQKNIPAGQQTPASVPAYGATQSVPAGDPSTINQLIADKSTWIIGGIFAVGLLFVMRKR